MKTKLDRALEEVRKPMTQSEQLKEVTTLLQKFLLAHNFTMARVRAGNLRRAMDLLSYEEGSMRTDEQREAILKSRAAEAEQQQLEQRDTQTDLPQPVSSTFGMKGSPE